MVSIESLYSQPTYTGGGGIPFFAGSRRQFGGGIFGSLARLVLPVVKNVFLPTATRALQTFGKSALNVGKNVAMDVLQGRNVKEALIDHSKQEAMTQLGNHFDNQPSTAAAPPTATATRGKRKRKSTGIKQTSSKRKKYF